MHICPLCSSAMHICPPVFVSNAYLSICVRQQCVSVHLCSSARHICPLFISKTYLSTCVHQQCISGHCDNPTTRSPAMHICPLMIISKTYLSPVFISNAYLSTCVHQQCIVHLCSSATQYIMSTVFISNAYLLTPKPDRPTELPVCPRHMSAIEMRTIYIAISYFSPVFLEYRGCRIENPPNPPVGSSRLSKVPMVGQNIALHAAPA